MSKRVWIDFCSYDFDGGAKVGTCGYLVECRDNNNRGRQSLSLRERPGRTNASREARLTGWLGETNNLSATAYGVWRIVRQNKGGDRAEIVRIHGADLCAFLAEDGHPDLIPGNLADAWDKGIDDGAEEVETVLNEQGADVVIATLSPGALGWDEGAINAHAHRLAGVPDEHRDVYYRAYGIGARDAAEAVKASHKAA